MEEAKIHLSLSEIELVTNADIILTKNVIIGKIKTVLEQLQRASCCTQLRHGNSAPDGDSLGRCPPPILDRPGRRP